MSGIKNFLDKRAEGIVKEKTIKDGVSSEDYASAKTEKEVDDIEESQDLTDEEFWTITNQFMKESKNNEKSAVEVLQSIIEGYTPLKIKQFAKRYEELNT